MKLWVPMGFAIILTASSSFAREQYPGQYAQYSDEERAWFRNQKSPKTGGQCCSEADGTFAEEDIRYDDKGVGHYWTRFTWNYYMDGHTVPTQSDWMQVPDDVIIQDPNRHGAPVVWWAWAGWGGIDGITATVGIRCYARGGGL